MKKSKYYIRVICGYRKEQEYLVNANEAHKAYYIFTNPDKKAVFDDGLALKGSDIQRIVPDYNSAMGWNPNHQLTNEDWNELHSNGLMEKMQGIMSLAKEVAKNGSQEELTTPLIELSEKYPQLRSGSAYAQKILGA